MAPASTPSPSAASVMWPPGASAKTRSSPTAGAGGMSSTNHADLLDAMWAFKGHVKTHEAVPGREHPPASVGCTALPLRGPAATSPTSSSPNCIAPSAASSCSACPRGPPPVPSTPRCLPQPWLIALKCACPCRRRESPTPSTSSMPS